MHYGILLLYTLLNAQSFQESAKSSATWNEFGDSSISSGFERTVGQEWNPQIDLGKDFDIADDAAYSNSVHKQNRLTTSDLFPADNYFVDSETAVRESESRIAEARIAQLVPSILHQIEDCRSCGKKKHFFCAKERWAINEPNIDDGFTLGEPLDVWGCANLPKKPIIVRDKENGKIYVVEPHTLHEADGCFPCGGKVGNVCDDQKWVANMPDVERAYTLGEPADAWGCGKVNDELILVRNSNTKKIYFVEQDGDEPPRPPIPQQSDSSSDGSSASDDREDSDDGKSASQYGKKESKQELKKEIKKIAKIAKNDKLTSPQKEKAAEKMDQLMTKLQNVKKGEKKKATADSSSDSYKSKGKAIHADLNVFYGKSESDDDSRREQIKEAIKETKRQVEKQGNLEQAKTKKKIVKKMEKKIEKADKKEKKAKKKVAVLAKKLEREQRIVESGKLKTKEQAKKAAKMVKKLQKKLKKAAKTVKLDKKKVDAKVKKIIKKAKKKLGKMKNKVEKRAVKAEKLKKQIKREQKKIKREQKKTKKKLKQLKKTVKKEEKKQEKAMKKNAKKVEKIAEKKAMQKYKKKMGLDRILVRGSNPLKKKLYTILKNGEKKGEQKKLKKLERKFEKQEKKMKKDEKKLEKAIKTKAKDKEKKMVKKLKQATRMIEKANVKAKKAKKAQKKAEKKALKKPKVKVIVKKKKRRSRGPSDTLAKIFEDARINAKRMRPKNKQKKKGVSKKDMKKLVKKLVKKDERKKKGPSKKDMKKLVKKLVKKDEAKSNAKMKKDAKKMMKLVKNAEKKAKKAIKKKEKSAQTNKQTAALIERASRIQNMFEEVMKLIKHYVKETRRSRAKKSELKEDSSLPSLPTILVKPKRPKGHKRQKDLKDRLKNGWQLRPAQYLKSKKGNCFLGMEPKGNLVLRKGKDILYSSGTDGKKGSHLELKSGKLVIMYNGEPIWDEWRAPKKEKVYNLLLTDQCTVNLFNKKGKKVFSTNPDFKSKKKSIDNVSVDGSCKFGEPIFLESHQGKRLVNQKGKIRMHDTRKSAARWQIIEGDKKGQVFIRSLKSGDHLQDSKGGVKASKTQLEWETWTLQRIGNKWLLISSRGKNLMDEGGVVRMQNSKKNWDRWILRAANGDIRCKSFQGYAKEKDRLRPGSVLKAGQFRKSQNEQCAVHMQKDGNLVIFKGKNTHWTSNTLGKTGAKLKVRKDGDAPLVIEHKGKPVWAADTKGHKVKALVLANDCDLKLYTRNNELAWTSNSNVKVSIKKSSSKSSNKKPAKGPGGEYSGKITGGTGTCKWGEPVYLKSNRDRVLEDDQGEIKLKDTPRRQSQWEILDAGKGRVFIAGHRGQYLQDTGDRKVATSRKQMGRETWTLTHIDKGEYIIMGHSQKNLVDDDGKARVRKNQKEFGRWKIVSAKDGRRCEKFKGQAKQKDRLRPGEQLREGDWIKSRNSACAMHMQSDGNLALYTGPYVTWASNTQGNKGAIFKVHEDGEVDITVDGKRIWKANTVGRKVRDVMLQNDCNLVMYDRRNMRVWAIHQTNQKTPDGKPKPGQKQEKSYPSKYVFAFGDKRMKGLSAKQAKKLEKKIEKKQMKKEEKRIEKREKRRMKRKFKKAEKKQKKLKKKMEKLLDKKAKLATPEAKGKLGKDMKKIAKKAKKKVEKIKKKAQAKVKKLMKSVKGKASMPKSVEKRVKRIVKREQKAQKKVMKKEAKALKKAVKKNVKKQMKDAEKPGKCGFGEPVYIISQTGKSLQEGDDTCSMGNTKETWQILDAGNKKVFIAREKGKHLAYWKGKVKVSRDQLEWEKWRLEPSATKGHFDIIGKNDQLLTDESTKAGLSSTGSKWMIKSKLGKVCSRFSGDKGKEHLKRLEARKKKVKKAIKKLKKDQKKVFDNVTKGNLKSKNKMRPGTRVNSGEFIESPNKECALHMQRDGNLVLYKGHKVMWAANTYGKKSAYLRMQSDGKVVVMYKGAAVWSADNGEPGEVLTLSNECNLILYNKKGESVWSSSRDRRQQDFWNLKEKTVATKNELDRYATESRQRQQLRENERRAEKTQRSLKQQALNTATGGRTDPKSGARANQKAEGAVKAAAKAENKANEAKRKAQKTDNPADIKKAAKAQILAKAAEKKAENQAEKAAAINGRRLLIDYDAMFHNAVLRTEEEEYSLSSDENSSEYTESVNSAGIDITDPDAELETDEAYDEEAVGNRLLDYATAN